MAEREDKPAWSAVPAALRVAVEETLGSRVARAVRAYGGYGPSATFVLSLRDGRRTFFKGIYPLPEGSGVQWSLDAEERVYQRLSGRIRPWAPEYLGSVRLDGWHALLLEAVDGGRVPPWTYGAAKLAARSYAAFHKTTLGQRLPGWLSRTQHNEFAVYWRRLSEDEDGRERLAALAGRHWSDAAAWLASHLETLARAEATLLRTAEPFALLHFDTRSDNVRLEGELLRIFDWPFASAGPAEFDAAAFAQSIAAEGGPAPEAVLQWYEEVLPLRRDVLLASVVGLAGYFADRAPRPHVRDLPRLRYVQRIQLKASLGWAARLLELPIPTWLTFVPPTDGDG